MSRETPFRYYVSPRVQAALDELAAAVSEYQKQEFGRLLVYIPDEHLAQRGLEVNYNARANLLILRTAQSKLLPGEVVVGAEIDTGTGTRITSRGVEHYTAQQAHEEELAAIASGYA